MVVLPQVTSTTATLSNTVYCTRVIVSRSLMKHGTLVLNLGKLSDFPKTHTTCVFWTSIKLRQYVKLWFQIICKITSKINSRILEMLVENALYDRHAGFLANSLSAADTLTCLLRRAELEAATVNGSPSAGDFYYSHSNSLCHTRVTVLPSLRQHSTPVSNSRKRFIFPITTSPRDPHTTCVFWTSIKLHQYVKLGFTLSAR